tara:strand:+ start:5783 stop:6709 length:927 start_codon:yes stop_codon:yes gene_type:complete
MKKKILFICLSFILIFTTIVQASNIFIKTTVNDQIITNYDIKKESEYLKILNPNLSNLDENQILSLAKNSLINEIIKKKEFERIFDINEENSLVDEYLKNLYTKLNFDNEVDFKNSLIDKNNYNLNEIKEKIKIEILWNEFIYLKYKNQVKINKTVFVKKIEDMSNIERIEYLLSEIVFKKKNEDINLLIKEIETSINEIGFNNTANIYSISESSKFGGKIGWVSESNLSEIIFNSLKKIDEGQLTNVLQIGNNFIILKIEEKRSKKVSINKNEELDKMIKFETNKQLNQFSQIYFNKAKLNYSINEK